MTADQTTEPLDVAAIRARVDAASPGPWESGLEIDGVHAGRRTVVRAASGQRLLSVGQTRSHDAERAEANAEFAAHARTDVPKLLAALAAAHEAYELKVQDLARETARLGKLIDVLAAHGHSADDTSRRCLACSICRALREVTGQEPTR